MIRVFDVAQPGRSFEARPTCKTRKSKTGQRGIISALAFSPDTSGGGLFAAGSYAKTICLYSANRWADDGQRACLAAGRRLSLVLRVLLSLLRNCVARTWLSCGHVHLFNLPFLCVITLYVLTMCLDTYPCVFARLYAPIQSWTCCRRVGDANNGGGNTP